jgi:hypothetical protein
VTSQRVVGTASRGRFASMSLPGCMGDAPYRLADSARHRSSNRSAYGPAASRSLRIAACGEHISWTHCGDPADLGGTA